MFSATSRLPALPPLLPGQQRQQLTSTASAHRLVDRESEVATDATQQMDPTSSRNSVGATITKIEEILGSVQQDLLHQRELSLPYRSRRNRYHRRQAGSSQSNATRDGVVRFPGSTPLEARRFARVIKLLQLAHDALVAGNLLTKRNVYYQDADLFRTQDVVDQLVDDLAYTLGVGREDLNIVAAGKGLMAGPVHVGLSNGSTVNASASGTLIPPTRDVRSFDFGAVRWILVIEKEATFRALVAGKYWQTSGAGPGLLITGKGFPDLATRGFLHTVHSTKPELPVYVLVDFDPDGIHIMRCYKHGSRSLEHESHLKVPRLRWLGLKCGDIVPRHRASADDDVNNHFSGTVPFWEELRHAVTAPLSARDRLHAARLIEATGQDDAHAEDVTCRRELQVMMVLGVKAEIQAVDTVGDVADWLDENLRRELQRGP